VRRRGFTLIELLIVVAIIAILAAIAVPNFLEAQTRAKVSRVEADMRSLATALEAYRIDNNRYPEAARSGTFLSFEERLQRVTTPIAYITSLPLDPFEKIAGMDMTFDYIDRASTESIPATANAWLPFPGFPSLQAKEWRLQSVGPDQVQSLLLGNIPVQYDATNGTISFGDIHRYGP
jgi:type II secretion system protein G